MRKMTKAVIAVQAMRMAKRTAQKAEPWRPKACGWSAGRAGGRAAG